MNKMLFALLCLLSHCLLHSAAGGVVIEEVYGDSLSAGFLADTTLDEPLSTRAIKQIKRRIVVAEALNMATVRRPRRALELYDSPEHAWPYFLADRFDEKWKAEKRGLEIELQNYSVSGAKSIDLIREVGTLPEDEPLIKAMAFFFIGHNDLSKSREELAVVVTRFLDNYTEALVAWDKMHKNSKAFILPVGDLTAAYVAIDDYTWVAKKNKRVTCDDMWRHYFPYWRFFPDGRKGSAEDFKDVVGEKIGAMNSGLAKVAEDFRSKNGNRVVYLKDLTKVKLKAKYFAADCFHLSKAGQRFLADLVFDAVTHR